MSSNISEYTVPWVAAGSRYGYELALKWINEPEQHVAAAGWSTLSNLVALKPDEELDIPALKALLARVEQTIHSADNRVRQKMNGFLIAVGSYVTPLSDYAVMTAKKIGTVTVDMNGTACKVPDAETYISESLNKNVPVKKKKTGEVLRGHVLTALQAVIF